MAANGGKDAIEPVAIRRRPAALISPDLKELKIRVKLTSTCKGQPPVFFSELIRTKIEHHWNIKADLNNLNAERTVKWVAKGEQFSNTSQEDITHTLDIINKGPSLNTRTKLFVFIPSDPLVKNEIVKVDEQICKSQKIQPPPAGGRQPNPEETEYLRCKTSTNCKIYSCNVAEKTDPKDDHKKKIIIKYTLDKREAETRSKTNFDIETSICTLDHKTAESECGSKGNLAKVRTILKVSTPVSTVLAQIVNNWQIAVGGLIGIIVVILMSLIFWKCNLHQKVRVYDNMMNEAENAPPDDAGAQVEGEEKVEMRG